MRHAQSTPIADAEEAAERLRRSLRWTSRTTTVTTAADERDDSAGASVCPVAMYTTTNSMPGATDSMIPRTPPTASDAEKVVRRQHPHPAHGAVLGVHDVVDRLEEMLPVDRVPALRLTHRDAA